MSDDSPAWYMQISNAISVGSFRRIVCALDAAGLLYSISVRSDYILLFPEDPLFRGYRSFLKAIQERVDCGRGWVKVFAMHNDELLAETVMV